MLLPFTPGCHAVHINEQKQIYLQSILECFIDVTPIAPDCAVEPIETLPMSPQLCEHWDQGDQSDSWQLTGHSTVHDVFICHFFSSPNCKKVTCCVTRTSLLMMITLAFPVPFLWF